MEEVEFRRIADAAWDAVPEEWRERLTNVALLTEDELDEDTRSGEGLEEGESLLGLYRGVPLTLRGSEYGVGPTYPDTVTLYRLPILEEAEAVAAESGIAVGDAVRIVVQETLWHELGHYFGLPDEALYPREDEGSNRFS